MSVPSEPLAFPIPAQTPDSPFNTPQYKEAEEFFQERGAGQRPEKWQEVESWEMCVVHRYLLSLLERVYLFAPWAKEHNDLENYLGWAEVALYQLYSHHHHEECKIFPAYEKAAGLDIWEQNVEQHHQFHKQIVAAWIYVQHCRKTLDPPPKIASPVPVPSPEVLAEVTESDMAPLDKSKPFDPVALQKQMEGWIPPLVHHLKDEIATLKPEYLDKIGKKDVDLVRADTQKYLQAYDPKWFLCAAFISLPISVCKDLMPLPYLVRRILVPFVFAPKYMGFWRYGEHPENLTFWGTA